MIPLRGWGIVILGVLLVFGFLGYADLPADKPFKNTHEMRYSNYKIRLHNLVKAEVEQKNEYRVIIFGSSLTAQGVLRDSFFNQTFQRMGKPIKVNRVFYAGAFYKMLEDPDLLDYLEAVQPDLLCIEDQVFFFTPLPGLDWPQTSLTQFHKNYVYNLNVLKHLLFPSVFPEQGFERQIDSTLTFDVKYPQADSVISHADSSRYDIKYRTVRKMRRTRKFNRLVDRLTQNATDLVILNVPRPAKIENVYLTKRESQKKDRLLLAYQDRFDTEYWKFERSFPFRYYWDISHLNKYGQLAYSDWLLERIHQHYQNSIQSGE